MDMQMCMCMLIQVCVHMCVCVCAGALGDDYDSTLICLRRLRWYPPPSCCDNWQHMMS